MKRREVVRILGWAASAAAASPVFGVLDEHEQERIIRAVQMPSRVDHRVIDHIDEVLWRCMRQDDALGPQAALDTVLAQRSLARAMLAECPQRLRQRLLSVYSNLSGYAGWLAFDLTDFEGASYYYEEARTVAHEAHDTELGALILCNMSHLATWRGRPRVGIDHAVAAQGWAKQTDNAALRAYAADRAARAHAMGQQHQAAMVEIAHAQTWLAEVGERSPTSLMYFYDQGLLATTTSICLLEIGDTKQAIDQAQQSLSLIDGSFVRNRAFATLYLADAHTLASQVDDAAEIIGNASDLAIQNRSARLVNTLRTSRSNLQPWAGTDAVKVLDERLAAYGLC